MSDKKGQIYYSLDNGIDWKLISKVNISDNYFKWDVPNLEFSSNQCLIKVIVDNYSNYDFLDNFGNFQISSAPFIDIVNNNRDTVKTNMPFEIKIKTKNINVKTNINITIKIKKNTTAFCNDMCVIYLFIKSLVWRAC
mgnify:CR=1 FL=1